MSVLLKVFGGLAGQDLLGGLLLGFVVVGIADQPVTHTVEHVDDVAEGLVHLAHGVIGRHLGRAAPAGTGDVLARCPHLAGLVLHRLGVHIETARHRPHLVRVSHKTRRHNSVSLSDVISALMRCAATASPASHPPAGVRVSTFTGAVLAAWVPTPRPLSEPMRAWVKGLLGRPADGFAGLTLVSGKTGAARAISGAPLAQLFGIDSPPNRLAEASWALIDDANPRISPEMPAIKAFILPSRPWLT